MMKKLFKVNSKLHKGLDIIRILTGAIIVSFGFEIFNGEQMAGYVEWLTDVGMPLPNIMAYVGKLAELICGALFTFGLFTRGSSIPLMLTMIVVNFIMLDGNPQSQPFYLLLLFLTFFILGSGRISLDYVLIGEVQDEELSETLS